MIRNTIVNFKKGSVLTANMLSVIQENSEKAWKLYEDYPDGVISGFELKEDNNDIHFSKGIVKVKDNIYTLDEDVSFKELLSSYDDKTEADCLLVLSEDAEHQIEESVFEKAISLKIIKKSDFKETSGDIVLLNFTSAKQEYRLLRSLKDINKAGYNVDIFYQYYSSETGLTFNPYVSELIRDYLYEKSDKVEFDYTILCELYNRKSISPDILKLYIERFDSEKNTENLSDKKLIEMFISVVDKIHTVHKEEKIIKPVQNDGPRRTYY